MAKSTPVVLCSLCVFVVGTLALVLSFASRVFTFFPNRAIFSLLSVAAALLVLTSELTFRANLELVLLFVLLRSILGLFQRLWVSDLFPSNGVDADAVLFPQLVTASTTSSFVFFDFIGFFSLIDRASCEFCCFGRVASSLRFC